MSYRLILERLTIAGTSYQINQELSRHGAVATDPKASVVVVVGKLKGNVVGNGHKREILVS